MLGSMRASRRFIASVSPTWTLVSSVFIPVSLAALLTKVTILPTDHTEPRRTPEGLLTIVGRRLYPVARDAFDGVRVGVGGSNIVFQVERVVCVRSVPRRVAATRYPDSCDQEDNHTNPVVPPD